MKSLICLMLAASFSLGALPVSAADSASMPAASANATAPDLDLTLRYYSRVQTAEGVQRESRYEEKMLRRRGHVWVARVLPATSPAVAQAAENKPGLKKVAHQHTNALDAAAAGKAGHQHAEFNPVVIPRHVVMENGKLRLEFVDAVNRQIIAIPATEYDNVNFDGSWNNAYYLLEPKQLAALPRSSRKSDIAGASWREREANGVFQRVLWDEKRQIPLLLESGDKAGRFFNRIEIAPQASLRQDLPWQNLKGYGQKEYADFLD